MVLVLIKPVLIELLYDKVQIVVSMLNLVIMIVVISIIEVSQ